MQFIGRGIAYGNNVDAEVGVFAGQRVVAIDGQFAVFYFGTFEKAVCNEHRLLVTEAIKNKTVLPEFPEELLSNRVDNTWRDTAGGVLGNWMGLIYQITHSDRRKPFMDHIDSNDPLNLKWSGVKK